MKIDIKSITVLTNTDGVDLLIIECQNLIEGCWPYEHRAKLSMHIAGGSGIRYAEQNFKDIDLSVIDLKTGNKHTFIRSC